MQCDAAALAGYMQKIEHSSETWKSPEHDLWISDPDPQGVCTLRARFNVPSKDGIYYKLFECTFLANPASKNVLPLSYDAVFRDRQSAWDAGQAFILEQHEHWQRACMGPQSPADLNYAVVSKVVAAPSGSAEQAAESEHKMHCSVCNQTDKGAAKGRRCNKCARRNFCDECTVEFQGRGTYCLPCARAYEEYMRMRKEEYVGKHMKDCGFGTTCGCEDLRT